MRTATNYTFDAELLEAARRNAAMLVGEGSVDSCVLACVCVCVRGDELVLLLSRYIQSKVYGLE